MAWRAKWLAAYAMGASKIMACRAAHVGWDTMQRHLTDDPDFLAQAEAAKAMACELLFTRMMQRAVEGDCEPIMWQGIEVGHIRKFDSRLQIEMLRAHMPERFKTPGQAQVTVNTGDNVLVLTEERRAKLMAARRRALEALPSSSESQACADLAQVTSG